MKFALVFTTVFLLLLSACDTATPDAPPTPPPAEETPKAIVEVKDDRIPIELQGWYATSTASDSKLAAAFDQDPQSAWQTIKGAGPDEGIMLYFSNPTFLKNIQIDAASAPQLATITKITIYGNGAPIAQGVPGETIELEETYENIYLRISAVEQTEIFTEVRENQRYDTLAREVFDPNFSVGFAGVKLIGDRGEMRLVPPTEKKGTAKASSTLNPETPAYDVSQLFDARREFVWVEGADGQGVGEQLIFHFDEEVQIDALLLWNGYQRSEVHYKANTRLRNFTFAKIGEEAQTY